MVGMYRNQAMLQINQMLKKDFKYLYNRQNIDIHAFRLTFIMDSKSNNLQMTFNFREKCCDILCFISPTVLSPNSDNYRNALQVVNYINWYIKSWGRYYIDTNGDLAYSLRLDYDVLEKMPNKCAREIECVINYYADLFIPLLNICQGKSTFENAKEFIDNMWEKIN